MPGQTIDAEMDIEKYFVFSGYNRLARSCVYLVHLRSAEAMLSTTGSVGPELEHQVQRAIGVLIGRDIALPDVGSRRPEDRIGSLFAATCIAVQRAAGHEVAEVGVADCDESGLSRPWFEYDDPDAGHQVALLACRLLAWQLSTDPEPAKQAAGDKGEVLRRDLREFVSRFARQAMPADSRAIYVAAQDRGIPCLRLDRPPCDPIRGDFRLREHSLLRLGQGCRQHTVDGTFCVSRSEPVFPLIDNRRLRFEKLAALNLPLAATRPGARWCSSATRVLRAARQIGGPVAVRPLRSADGRGTTLHPRGEEELMRAAQRALQFGDQALVEPLVEGRTWLLPVCGFRAGTLLRTVRDGDRDRHEAAGAFDPSIAQLGEAVARELDVGMLVVRIIAPEATVALSASGGAVNDVDLAPRFDRIFADDAAAMRQAAGEFVDWIYPEPARSRIPVAAVTGTNGKTTTCRLLARILREAGHRTGLACSDGSFVDDRQISDLEDGYLPGHYTVLDNPEVEVAVLESTRAGAASTGLGFDRCSVATCLNITEDHLHDELGIRTLDEMAEIKRSIVETAEDAVALNADDARCRAMQSHVEGRRIGLASLRADAGELLALAGIGGMAAVVEPEKGEDWMVIHDETGRLPVAAVASIPICYQGRAVHNISNALHAMLLARFLGAEPEMMARGMMGLETGFETHYGRLNHFDGLPFDVVMDYAHNPDGMHHLKLFVQNTTVSGRKILNFSASAANRDDFIRHVGAAAAGGFDHYVCKSFGLLYDREAHEVPNLLREGLLSAGVSPHAITIVEEEFQSIDHTLSMAEPGDLVVIIGGKRKKEIWQLISTFAQRRAISGT